MARQQRFSLTLQALSSGSTVFRGCHEFSQLTAHEPFFENTHISRGRCTGYSGGTGRSGQPDRTGGFSLAGYSADLQIHYPGQ